MRIRVADGLVVAVKLLLGAVGVERRGPVVRDSRMDQPAMGGVCVSGSRSQERPKPFDISKIEVWAAWEQVRANRGAAGMDGVELAEFENRLRDNLYRVWNRMASGSYFPEPVRSVDIPKPGGGVRTLGVPTIADRVAQTVAAKRLEIVCEPLFCDDSYGFRPGRSAHDAVARCRDRCWQRRWVVDVDIASFFDEVDWDLLIRAVEALDVPSWVVLYVRRWLAADAVGPDGTVRARLRGTPQGGPVSPVLANLFLHWAVDAWLKREHPTVSWERYADDIVLHCVSKGQAEQVLDALARRMDEVGLRLHPEKTRIVYCGTDCAPAWDGARKFTFLGFDFRRRSAMRKDGKRTMTFAPAVSNTARKRMSQIMRSWRIARRTDLNFADLANWVNPVVRGWMNYYGAFRRSELYPLLMQLNAMLAKWVRRKYRRFQRWDRLVRRWQQVVAERPNYFVHWRWITGIGH
jgi:RNA-directed DNA polymerase